MKSKKGEDALFNSTIVIIIKNKFITEVKTASNLLSGVKANTRNMSITDPDLFSYFVKIIKKKKSKRGNASSFFPSLVESEKRVVQTQN